MKIKGCFNIELGYQRNQASSQVFFPSNKSYSQYKICAFQIQYGVMQNFDGVLPFYFTANNPGFVNLFDSKGDQFVYNAPLYLFSAAPYTGLLPFEPRRLDWSRCFIQFVSTTNEDGTLPILMYYV